MTVGPLIAQRFNQTGGLLHSSPRAEWRETLELPSVRHLVTGVRANGRLPLSVTLLLSKLSLSPQYQRFSWPLLTASGPREPNTTCCCICIAGLGLPCIPLPRLAPWTDQDLVSVPSLTSSGDLLSSRKNFSPQASQVISPPTASLQITQHA